MNSEQILEFQARLVRATIRTMGMRAENEQRSVTAQSPAYVEADFLKVIDEEGLWHNQVVTALYQS